MTISDPTQPFRHFQHARIDDVQIGPRRAITLTLTQLLWDGAHRFYGAPKVLRFGGIQQFDVVQQFSTSLPEHEVAWLRLSRTQPSKHNQLSIELVLERIDTKLVFQCQHLTVDDVEPDSMYQDERNQ